MKDKNLAPQTIPAFSSLKHPEVYDVVIVGGGPAGLSAALILGRCRRKVIVIDAGEPRNRSSRSMHGYLSRDGVSPAEMAKLSRDQLNHYPTVQYQAGRVVDAMLTKDGQFIAILDDGTSFMSRRMLLATGVVDDVPNIPGLHELYGTSVHHCPYCDAYEWKDQAIAVYGKSPSAANFAQELTAWSRNLILCTDGSTAFDEEQIACVQSMRIRVRQEPVAWLEARRGTLTAVHFASGAAEQCDALFFCTAHSLAGNLSTKLGCRHTDQGCVWTEDHECTSIPGLYCAGDASKNSQLVIIAAAEGARAAVCINKSLTEDYLCVKNNSAGALSAS